MQTHSRRSVLKKFKILAIDNDIQVLQILEKILSKAGYECITEIEAVNSVKSALREQPDLIIIDRMMPGKDGVEIAIEIKSKPQLSQIPILMLTAMCSEDEKIFALERGIDDYFCKPFSSKELLAKIKAILRHSTRVRDSNPTTNLPGGNALEEEINRRLREGTVFALLHVDIDNFKTYADSYGFNSANRMIRLCGKILVNAIESLDLAGSFLSHIGGDDFIIVTPPQSHEKLARKIIEFFDGHIGSCFKKEDSARGYYTSLDRKGSKRDFPITTVSIGIVSNEKRPFIDASEMGTYLVKAKNRAKEAEEKKQHRSTFFFLDEIPS
jgi:diguanylate cyclase (GGDEF)-like protein